MSKLRRYFSISTGIALFGVFLIAFTAQASTPDENFNPGFIISDQEVLDHDCMSQEEIQEFLEGKNSYLANYTCENPDTEETLKASEVIYNRATANKVSPKFLLVLLQKEMSLIEDDSPGESQLKWATGYGCPDGGGCNDRWEGFWKQVNSASLQFRDYMDNPDLYNYQKGKPYTFDNPYSTTKQETTTVIPQNKATAALYNYTPHVYNGNYNFYRTWQRYFTKDYPDGSLLRAEGEGGVWLIDDGEKRPFHTQTALTSRFDKNKVITIPKSTLSNYPKGAPVRFPNYSLVKSPRGNIYLLVDNKKRKIANDEAFRNIGYNPAEVMNASWQDIRGYEDGKPITATSTYPTGALLQNNQTGGVYWVYEGAKAPIMARVFLDTKFKNKHIISVAPQELEKYETRDAVRFDNGELITPATSPAVYLVVNDKLRPFVSAEAFEEMGYKWENIITVPAKILGLYEKGETITKQGS